MYTIYNMYILYMIIYLSIYRLKETHIYIFTFGYYEQTYSIYIYINCQLDVLNTPKTERYHPPQKKKKLLLIELPIISGTLW